jgi:pyruvate formate lyase activating enzyme
MSLIYMDLKLADPERHKEYTGVDNASILRNLEYLRGKNAVIRTPLIPGITDTEENLAAIKKLVGYLPHELLPYNEMADAKYGMLGMEYPLKEQR